MLNAFKFLGVLTLAAFFGCCSAVAERYLSVAEVQRVCFPTAEKFEGDVIRFTSEQKKELEKNAGVPVRNSGNQFWIALSLKSRQSFVLAAGMIKLTLGHQ